MVIECQRLVIQWSVSQLASTPTRQKHIVNHYILYSSLSLYIFRCQNFGRYVAIQLSEQEDGFLSVKLVNNVNGYHKK